MCAMTHFGNVSTFPPTQCGLATFSEALLAHLASRDDTADVVSIVDTPESGHPPVVTHQWVKDDPDGPERAARALDTVDVAIIQHEFGIYPGPDGERVLELVRALRVPFLVVLHTVLVTPGDNQRRIIDELVERAAAVVTMTRTARDRLTAHYAVTDTKKLHVISHGAPVAHHPVRPDAATPPAIAAHAGDRPARESRVLTWGLLGEGKGIEWGIDALTALLDVEPAVTYYVVGETHPKVVEQVGERYREGLRARAAARGVGDRVVFVDAYLSREDLEDIAAWADVVLLPYDSRDQVTSGVLVEAVAAARPVVSTDFPHARELLASGAGLLVPPQDAAAIAAALRRVFTEPDLVATMTTISDGLSSGLLWPEVADAYRRVARDILRSAVDSCRASAG